MFCQVCNARNPDDEEFCVRCQSKLLVLSGVGVVEEGRESHEEIPFDEHLLERISTLEEVVKRTGDALKSLFESLGNLERNLFVAHTGVLALQRWLETNGRGVSWGSYRCEKWGKGQASLHSVHVSSKSPLQAEAWVASQ